MNAIFCAGSLSCLLSKDKIECCDTLPGGGGLSTTNTPPADLDGTALASG